jgi:Histidine kinase-, DNA gyrase B-, and HSP90-like ATPase
VNEVPQLVVQCRLYRRLLDDEDLAGQLRSIRGVVLALADTTSRTVPNFTDHTVRHMDALWTVAERVLTPDEMDRLTAAEAFLLGCGFYLHDIGMAFAATDEGLRRIKESDAYRSFMTAIPEAKRQDPDQVGRGVSVAVRRLHADAAMELATNVVPGSNNYCLIEAQSFREAWGTTCGQIASSHHWNLPRLEATFGPQSDVPLPGGRRGDLLFVASCLRIIDYAHINRDRAPTVDRAFRRELDPESLVHWLAQENIDGPERADAELVYRAANPISDVDAWWLYYEMLTGLDQEIRSVKKMLDQRPAGLKRISLQGVRGVSAPEEAAKFIPTAGFLPIEVNLRAGSIERLVELLAGETLYGPNPMAAVRELIQNARDAVMLKGEVATSEAERAALCIPIRVRLDTKSDPPTLEIVDHGVGMTRRVMIDYLISIASDYWTSQFPVDFPAVAERGFKNAGRFGIGFLSVFMLGAELTVQSNRAGGERNQLSLRGVGRRGEVRQLPLRRGAARRSELSSEPLRWSGSSL